MTEWFEIINKDMRAEKAKLFLFPYAGGGASVFRKWKDLFDGVKLYAAQYPGRENRVKEEPVTEFHVLLDMVFRELKELVGDNDEYYLFGHSLGTKIVYEIALKMKQNKLPGPKGIIVSAGRAPCYKEENPIHHLDDSDFIREIHRFSGTPAEIIENFDIMKLFIPMIKADFLLDETYLNERINQIDIPILGLMGTTDHELTVQELEKWREYTKKQFRYEYIEGGHMFINTNYKKVICKIKEFINECI